MKKRFKIPVNFTTTITVDVVSNDIDEAKANAEFDALRIFSTLMAEGSLYPVDFVAHPEEPVSLR